MGGHGQRSIERRFRLCLRSSGWSVVAHIESWSVVLGGRGRFPVFGVLHGVVSGGPCCRGRVVGGKVVSVLLQFGLTFLESSWLPIAMEADSATWLLWHRFLSVNRSSDGCDTSDIAAGRLHLRPSEVSKATDTHHRQTPSSWLFP